VEQEMLRVIATAGVTEPGGNLESEPHGLRQEFTGYGLSF